MSTADSLITTPNKHGDSVKPGGRSPVDEMSATELRARVEHLEESLQRLEDRLAVHERVFYENPVPAIVYSVENLSILKANERARELYGYKAEEIGSLNVMDLFAPSAREKYPDLDERLRKPLNAVARVTHRSAAGRDIVVSLASR